MKPIPYIDIHTHSLHAQENTVAVKNIYPGDGFAAFTGRNFYSVGLHPWHISTEEENNEALKMVEDALEFDHVIFVGETGLDKLVNTDFDEQQRVFEAQAFMAEEYQYPLVIHCVKAVNEIISLHHKMNPAMPWIMHGFNGSLEITKQLLNNGMMFSFGEGLFRNNSKGLEAFKYLPLDRIFFETDESKLTVERIYNQGAKLKAISVEKLKIAIWKNFNRVENSLATQF